MHDKQPRNREKHMKNIETTEQNDDMLTEYPFDYSKAKPNCFAKPNPQLLSKV